MRRHNIKEGRTSDHKNERDSGQLVKVVAVLLFLGLGYKFVAHDSFDFLSAQLSELNTADHYQSSREAEFSNQNVLRLNRQPATGLQLDALVRDIKFITTAYHSFRDVYSALPGDMSHVDGRLPNCQGCSEGDGDGAIGDAQRVDALRAPEQDERLYFWHHLYAANLHSTRDVPTMPFGGVIQVANINPRGVHSITGRQRLMLPRGHYLVLGNPSGGKDSVPFFTPKEAAYIDQQLDDGMPSFGNVIALGAERCYYWKKGTNGPSVYNTKLEVPCFTLFIKL